MIDNDVGSSPGRWKTDMPPDFASGGATWVRGVTRETMTTTITDNVANKKKYKQHHAEVT